MVLSEYSLNKNIWKETKLIKFDNLRLNIIKLDALKYYK